MPRKELATNAQMEKGMQALASVLGQRVKMAQQLGVTYGGERDVYTALGYKKTLEFQDYWNKYTRQDISKRVIDMFPNSTWAGVPNVFETENPERETAFEKDLDKLVKNIDIYHYCNRVDKLSRIGRYAVLYLGFADNAKTDKQVTKAKQLLYMQPFSEQNAQILTFDKNVKSPRYGQPETYKLSVASANASGATFTGANASVSTNTITVHWSRVIHVADGLVESNVFGTPALECIYNRLDNLQLLTGGSAEMFWRAAYYGMALQMDKDAKMSEDQVKALDENVDKFTHQLTRVLKLQGIEAKSLAPQLSSPKEHVDVQLDLIAGAKGVPKRILTGSERGELASSQDKANWNELIAARRGEFAEPQLLRPLLDRFIAVGILTPPAEETGYTVGWPVDTALTEKEQAEISKLQAEAIKAYTTGAGEFVMPTSMFLSEVMHFDEKTVAAIMEIMTGILKNEDAEGNTLKTAFDKIKSSTGSATPAADDDTVLEE